MSKISFNIYEWKLHAIAGLLGFFEGVLAFIEPPNMTMLTCTVLVIVALLGEREQYVHPDGAGSPA